MTSQRPTSELNDHHTMSVIEGISQAVSPELALDAFEKALAGVGVNILPSFSFLAPVKASRTCVWRGRCRPTGMLIIQARIMFQRDPAVRYSFCTVMPFDWGVCAVRSREGA